MKNLNKILKSAQAGAQAGFSLMGLVMGIVGTNVIKRFDESKVNSTKIQIRNLAVMLQDYRRVCGLYPKTDQGLEALVKPPAECKNADPDGFIKRLPKDAWTHDFLYSSDGNKFVIKSLGSDNAEGGTGFDADINSEELE